MKFMEHGNRFDLRFSQCRKSRQKTLSDSHVDLESNVDNVMDYINMLLDNEEVIHGSYLIIRFRTKNYVL